MNANTVLSNINSCIAELEELQGKNTLPNPDRMVWKGYSNDKYYKISGVCEELNIFDWFTETLSLSQLKQMKKFVETAIKLGFTGYTCFKVGAKYCAHGMWVHKNESTTGYSPDDGDVLYHSFRSGENYYDGKINGVWLHDKYGTDVDFTLKQIKAELA